MQQSRSAKPPLDALLTPRLPHGRAARRLILGARRYSRRIRDATPSASTLSHDRCSSPDPAHPIRRFFDARDIERDQF